MSRFAMACVPLFVLGCSTVPTRSFAIDRAPPPAPEFTVPVDVGPAPAEIASSLSPAPAALSDMPPYHTVFAIKGGYYSTTNTSALDDGYILSASWTDFFSKVFGLEFEAGYLDASGKGSGISTDVWGIPVMLNGRLNLPLGSFDVYGGLGVGSIYYDVSSSGSGLDKSDWVFAGDGFLGTDVRLGDSITLGLEGKYYLTDKISVLDGGLDAYAVMLTLGFSR